MEKAQKPTIQDLKSKAKRVATLFATTVAVFHRNHENFTLEELNTIEEVLVFMRRTVQYRNEEDLAKLQEMAELDE